MLLTNTQLLLLSSNYHMPFQTYGNEIPQNLHNCLTSKLNFIYHLTNIPIFEPVTKRNKCQEKSNIPQIPKKPPYKSCAIPSLCTTAKPMIPYLIVTAPFIPAASLPLPASVIHIKILQHAILLRGLHITMLHLGHGQERQQ